MVSQHQQLVAYDLGTGKTVLTIATIEQLLDEGHVDLGLVVCANTLKYQWLRELTKFTGDGARTLVIDGQPRTRWRQYKRVLKGEAEYVIVNWDQVKNDWSFIGDIDWDFVVLDEATMIKGFTSRVSKKVKRLQPEYRYALSGQPLENRPEDIFSIMQFVNRGVLGDYVDYDRTFIDRNQSSGQIKKIKNIPLWHETMAPWMVRKSRNDPDVAKYMPKVAPEQVFAAYCDGPTRKLYLHIVQDLLNELAEMRGSNFDIFTHYGDGDGADSAAKGRVMSRLTALRMLCDHPELLRISAEKWAKGLDPETEKSKHGSLYCYDLDQLGMLEGLRSTPKLDVLVETTRSILDADPKNKVVIFSFFVDMLRFIGESMQKYCGHVIFDGTMSAKKKDKVKQEFANDPHCRLFISSDAGGYGLNLPNANYLTSYDLPWSTGKLKQRNSRIDRMSSEFGTIYHQVVMVDGSIEERQYDLLDQKGAMASAMVDNEGDIEDGSLTLDNNTLTKFLEETSV